MTDLKNRYATAESLLAANLKGLIDSPRVQPNWVEGTETFWYRNTTAKGNEFLFVDAATGEKRPAFDHERMAEALRPLAVVGEVSIPVEPFALPFQAFEFRDGSIRANVLGKLLAVSLETYDVKDLGEARSDEVSSPDGRYSVGVKDHNLFIRDTETGEVRALTTDGVEYFDYGSFTGGCSNLVMQENLGIKLPPLVAWSPDSKRFITHRLDQRDVPLMYLVRSAPADGGRPKLLSYPYSLPGDEKFATAEFLVFDAASGTVTPAKHDPVPTPFVPTIGYGFLWWNKDATKAFWLSQDRGDRTGWLHELDPDTGDVRVLYTETTQSQILYGPQQFHRNIRVLASGEVLWWSQRNDYAHLYLVKPDGSEHALTEGDWNVRHVISLDESTRTVVFTGAGWAPGSDPYMQQLFSVSLDTGALTPLTSDDLDHDAMFMSMSFASDSGAYFVDNVSRYDTPNVAVLRNRAGEAVLELERADATKLYEVGWTPAERAVVKGADGETDVYCAIYKPFDFDPTKKYPIVDETYPGPQNSCAPLRFPMAGGEMVAEWSGAQFAALGFVAVVIDGRGGAHRTKSFQDYSRQPGDPFVADHVAAIKQLAQTRPWMDLDRVGILGESRGGYAAMKAILREPDFFKVCVSSCGDHDDRVNHAWWGEKFMGLVDEFDYVDGASATHVENLKGKVLLAHGEMDDNCLPHNTMRLVDALIKANKDFDFFIVPNVNHGGLCKSGYWFRRRWDYFVQHLLGETPPEYNVPDQPMMPS